MLGGDVDLILLDAGKKNKKYFPLGLHVGCNSIPNNVSIS